MNAAAKVGLFVIVVLIVLGYLTLKIEDVDIGTGPTQRVQVVFDSVAGLDVKSAVRVAGVRMGKVLEVEVAKDGRRALVTMAIDGSMPIHADATARVMNLGLLGEKYIEFDPGTPGSSAWSGAELTGTQPSSIDDVTGQVSAIATDVKAITESVRKAMAGTTGEQRLEEIVENVRAITAQVRALIAANEGNVGATAANLKKITDDLRVEIPKIAASIDRVANSMGGTVDENRGNVRVIVENLKTLSGDLKMTADNLNEITGRVKAGEGTVGKLFGSNEAHDKLVSALGSVEGGLDELKNTLGRVGRVGLDVGVRSELQFGHEDNLLLGFDDDTRTGVQVVLRPSPDRNIFYNLELNADPAGKIKEKVTETTITDPATGVSSTLVTREVKRDREMVLSAQAGWQIDKLGLKAGLFDATGGVGADWTFNDRLKVAGEVYDFGGRYGDDPQLRVFSQFVIRRETSRFPRLFVTAGVDDAVNDAAFTVGAGIYWTDDDLKYLMGSAIK